MKTTLSIAKGAIFGRAGNFLGDRREVVTEAEQNVALGEMRIQRQERDDVLLRRAAKGDEEAFTFLYRRHQAALHRFALRMNGSAWAAEEIVQDVFMTLMREPKKFDATRGTLGAYLFGIARNRVMKYGERAPREVSLEEKHEDGSGRGMVLQDAFTPATWTEQKERLEQVRAAVLELPAEFRETVVLCELEELSYEEAAQLIGCPVGTIRSRLHRGRALLLAKLEMLRDVPRRANAAR
ncbi:MAG TPA: sigma-70 family RNA polymerase sigma factor [Candidatus Acidoferrum sp.]|nr:sigma-70 family RNA polymerase sigma factor [Candidatus Acidoferrum sp.]